MSGTWSWFRGGGTSSPISTLDRRWLDGHAATIITGAAQCPVEQSRAMVVEHMRRHPLHPLSCRVDRARRRWVAVPAPERRAHADRLLPTIDDVDPTDDEGMELLLRGQVDALPPELPFVMAAGRHTIVVIMCHALGDAVTLDRLLTLLIPGETEEGGLGRLARVEPRMQRGDAVRELVVGLSTDRGDWAAHFRNPLRPRPSAPPAPMRLRPERRPAFTGSVILGPALRELTRWRNRNAPRAGIAGLLTTATYRALTAQGVEIDGSGYYAILDLRPFLPRTPDARCGNLAKGLHLTAPLDDPAAVTEALRQAHRSRRVVPAIALGSAMRERRSAGSAPRKPLTLTFTTMPAFPTLDRLPRVDGVPRRLYAFGTPASPGGVVVSAVRLRDHMQVVASFDESTVPMPAVRAALGALTDPCALLEGLPVGSRTG